MMSDSLRDRIAAVLRAHPPVRLQSQFDWLDWTENRADAVIRELGWREETCVMANHADHDKRVIYTKVPLHRYVTEWEPSSD